VYTKAVFQPCILVYFRHAGNFRQRGEKETKVAGRLPGALLRISRRYGKDTERQNDKKERHPDCFEAVLPANFANYLTTFFHPMFSV